MLVLTRSTYFPTNEILIGDKIRVVVTRIEGKKVKLAIEAPPEIIVLRSELERHEREEGHEHATSKGV